MQWGEVRSQSIFVPETTSLPIALIKNTHLQDLWRGRIECQPHKQEDMSLDPQYPQAQVEQLYPLP